MTANNQSNYQDRMKPENNTGEILFKKWCLENEWSCQKLGFERDINNFWDLNPILRNIPDFVIEKGPKIFVVQVKGSPNFKQKEYNLIDEFVRCYYSDEAPLIYAFCFDKNPIFKKTEEVKKLYQQSQDKIWSDGKIYRTLNLK
jgi:hypothetical protein